MTSAEHISSGATPTRHYDKGERRRKHVGRGSAPIIEFSSGNPKMWVGKCPSTLSAEQHKELVNEAIPGRNGDRDLPFPKKLYVVHDGAIYEAQTTDHGYSYHGYPYRGKLASELITALRAMAVAKQCEDDFNRWVREQIEVHGTWS